MELILGFLLGLIVGLLMCYVCLEQTVKFFHKLHGQAVDTLQNTLKNDVSQGVPMPTEIMDMADSLNEQSQAQNEILKEWLFGKEGEEIG